MSQHSNAFKKEKRISDPWSGNPSFRSFRSRWFLVFDTIALVVLPVFTQKVCYFLLSRAGIHQKDYLEWTRWFTRIYHMLVLISGVLLSLFWVNYLMNAGPALIVAFVEKSRKKITFWWQININATNPRGSWEANILSNHVWARHFSERKAPAQSQCKRCHFSSRQRLALLWRRKTLR